MKKVGLITIGQSPRDDIVYNIRHVLGENIDIIETGALDRIEYPLNSEYAYKGGPHKGEIFVSRLKDGSEIKMDEERILPLIEGCISELKEKNVDAMALMCTGEYKSLESCRELVRPYIILHSFIDTIFSVGKIGIIVPTEHQVSLKHKEWNKTGREVLVVSASPYGKTKEVIQAARELADKGAQCIVLDCLGFSIDIKRVIKQNIDIPVILPGSLLAWVLRELI